VPAGPDILHRELNARSVELVIARGGAPSLGMGNLASKLSMTTCLSYSQVRKIHGPGGAGSSWPNWSTNLGRCRRRKARLRRPRWKHFAPAGSTVRACVTIAVRNVSGRRRWSKLAEWLAPASRGR
jgi:hypothetical protein